MIEGATEEQGRPRLCYVKLIIKDKVRLITCKCNKWLSRIRQNGDALLLRFKAVLRLLTK